MISLLRLRQLRPDLQRLYSPSGEAVDKDAPEVKGIPTLQDWYDQYGKEEHPELANRDLQAESEELQSFVNDTGSYPTRPEDFSLIAEMAYDNPPPELMSGLPRLELEKKSAFEDAYGEGGAVQQAQQAGQTSGNRLSILQDALKTKVGAYDAGIGRSKVFEEAGLSGMASLTQSLNKRREEISNSYERHRREISDMANIISSENMRTYNEANLAVQRYNEIKNEYNNELDYLRQIETEERQMQQQLDLYEKKLRLDAQINNQYSSSGIPGFTYNTDTIKALDQQQENPTQSFTEEKMAEFESLANEMIAQQNEINLNKKEQVDSQMDKDTYLSLSRMGIADPEAFNNLPVEKKREYLSKMKDNKELSESDIMQLSKDIETANPTPITQRQGWLTQRAFNPIEAFKKDVNKYLDPKLGEKEKEEDLSGVYDKSKISEGPQSQSLEKDDDYYKTLKDYVSSEWEREKTRYRVSQDTNLSQAARSASAKLMAGTPYTIALVDIQDGFNINEIEAKDVLTASGYTMPRTEEEIDQEARAYAEYLFLQGNDEEELSRKIQLEFKKNKDAAREIAKSVAKKLGN